MTPILAMCGNCGERLPKGQMLPATDGGAKCKDWFECARRREQLILSNVKSVGFDHRVIAPASVLTRG